MISAEPKRFVQSLRGGVPLKNNSFKKLSFFVHIQNQGAAWTHKVSQELCISLHLSEQKCPRNNAFYVFCIPVAFLQKLVHGNDRRLDTVLVVTHLTTRLGGAAQLTFDHGACEVAPARQLRTRTEL